MTVVQLILQLVLSVDLIKQLEFNSTCRCVNKIGVYIY